MFIPFHYILMFVALLGMGGNLAFDLHGAARYNSGHSAGHAEGVYHEAQRQETATAEAKRVAETEEADAEKRRADAVADARKVSAAKVSEWAAYAEQLETVLKAERANAAKSKKQAPFIPKSIADILNK